jgi:RNA polymerase sigma-70 factor (ECF subfamily)
MAEAPNDRPRRAPGQDAGASARLESASDAELVAAPVDEIAEAFAVFYRRHRWPILNYLFARTRGDTHLALDLLAEVFASAYEKRHTYEADKAPARAWLFRIANNALIDEHRGRAYERSARARLELPIFEYTDAAIAQVEERIDATEAGYLDGLAELPDDERDAIQARIIEDRDYADIAAAAAVSQAAIRKRVSRGLARLKGWRPNP